MGSTCCTTSNCNTPRNFMTKEEKIEKLNSYKQSLETEAKAVQERIDELKA